MTRVLVVDDEPALVRAVRINLAAHDYDVVLAYDGRSALKAAAEQRPDIVILDLGLPDIDGQDVISGIRGWSRIPIIVLSARDQEQDKVAALDAGADDYVTKPFGMAELLARVRAAERRTRATGDEPAVVTADFVIDLAGSVVRRPDGSEVRLTPTEWHILETLVRNRGRLVTAQQLLATVWGPGYEHEAHYLRVYLAQLRRKLESDPSRPKYLHTDPGMGYRFDLSTSG
ncbi:MAG: two-component system, OmpR family, operon response regulator KdpE [Frankiaceae bacterium]|jgi:two-component system KDP operon response regulator KdpE|nr:two-component system, OmpR family, operon response regulator KdpE [Frankiaceae bacterium]